MKNFISTTFLFCCLINALLSQRQADNWVWGLCNGNGLCNSPWGSGIIKFNDTSIESITSTYFDYRINKGSASISDSAGNLLLVFNGKYLFNSSGEIIDSFYLGNFSEMPVGFKSSLFLNVPNNQNNYCLFNSYWKPIFDIPAFGGFDTSFYYSEFINSSTEIQVLTRKQQINLDSSASGTIAAVRHGNGRDWWIMKSSIYQNKFYQALLGPNGFVFNPIFTDVGNIRHSGGGWNLFSSNGSKFVNIIVGNNRKAFVYDFDRCSGSISNPIMHDLSDYFNEDAVNACCLSPDGTKLYFRRSNMNAYLTIELCQYDFLTSTFSVIAEGNAAPCLTPNNQWVIAPYTNNTVSPWIPMISVIYQPDEPAEHCQFVQGVYNVVENGFIEVSPNYANFRLGPIDGSPCDTLGLDNPVTIKALEKEILDCNIYPNPCLNELYIKLSRSSEYSISLTDMLGKLHYSTQFNSAEHQINLSGQKFSEGIYWVEIVDIKRGLRVGKKIVRKPPGG